MRIKAFIALSFIIMASASSFAISELNLLDQKYIWRSPNPKTRIRFTKQSLTAKSNNSSPGIVNLVPLNLPAKKYDLLVIKMKASKGGIAEISWMVDNQPFAKEKSFAFYLKKPDKYQTYYLNLAPYIKGKKINRLLFFPFAGQGQAELVSFKFVKGSFWEKTLAGWQEFWGPRGREFTGQTFYVIISSQLFGKSILFYFNLLMLSTLLLSLLLKRPRLTIFLILSLWLFLEISSGINNWNFFQRDLRFWGKPLEEKRIMQNTNDFYQFMQFAKKKIPNNASFYILANPKIYQYSLARAQYYLYPRPLKDQPDFLLVLDAKPGEYVWQKYQLLYSFRKDALIFKEKNALR